MSKLLRLLRMLVLVIPGLVISCGAQKNECQYTAISVGSLLDTFDGEQGNVLRRYGLPNKAYQEPLGSTQWIYCDASDGPFLIEFDLNSQIVLMQKMLESNFYSLENPCKEFEKEITTGQETEQMKTPSPAMSTVGPQKILDNNRGYID